MRFCTLFALFLLATPIFGQQELSIAEIVLNKVNVLRDSLNVPKLELDPTLNVAADDHSYYMANTGKLSHFEGVFSKETPSERVLYHNGNRTYVGENIAKCSPVWVSKGKLNTEKIAAILFNEWFNSPGHYKNMIDPRYTKMGFSVRYDNDDEVYGTQVFSSNEIRLPKAFESSDLAWGVRPGEISCKDDPVVYETMYFANSVSDDGVNVYFDFHDMEFFKNVIKNDNDGLAIDVVLREQLPCDRENQFHISRVYDGEMQRPIYKYDIFKNNLSENPKKMKVKIGEVPSYLRNQQWDVNVIIINDNELCDYSVPVEIPSDIYPLLPIKPYYDLPERPGPPKPLVAHIKDSIHVELLYDRSKEKFYPLQTNDYYDLLNFSYFAQNIQVDCFASVEGKKWYNDQLLESRKKAVSELLEFDLLQVNSSITTAENWKMMQDQIRKHSIHELEGKTEDQVKYYLKKHPSPFLDSLLFEQRKTHIYAKFDTLVTLTEPHELSFASKYDSTLSILDFEWNHKLYSDHIQPEIPLEDYIFDTLYSNEQLKTNLLAAGSIEYWNGGYDSARVEQFVKEVDINNPRQLFNYAHFLTTYWFAKNARSHSLRRNAQTIEPEELRKMIADLDTAIIRKDDLVRLKVNILLSGIHYYTTHNDWRYVNQYFNEIVVLVKENNFNKIEAMELALFCNHFHKFKQAIDILHPFHEAQDLTEEGYFVLAKTSTLIRSTLYTDIYHSYMLSAKKVNKRRYCNWLDDQFQILRDEYIKRDFCSDCK